MSGTSPRRRKIENARLINGVNSSVCKRPYVAPRINDISAERSSTSVAVIRAPVTGASLSVSKAWRMRVCRLSNINCDTSKRPGISKGCNPFDPMALGIILPGVSSIFAGFNTPSSSACQIPVTAIDAFFKISSTTLFAVLISGKAFITGDLPYISPGDFNQRNPIIGD